MPWSSGSPRSRGASRPCSCRPARPPTTIGLLNIAESGDHIVSSRALYGGTVNLLKFTFKKLGIDVTFVDDQDDLEAWRAAVRPNTKAFFAETIANPKARCSTSPGVAGVAHEVGRAARRRQHDRDAVPHPPARVGRRRRHPLGDEVPRRPRHLDRRRHRRRRHLRLRPGPGEVPELQHARGELPRARVRA